MKRRLFPGRDLRGWGIASTGLAAREDGGVTRREGMMPQGILKDYFVPERFHHAPIVIVKQNVL